MSTFSIKHRIFIQTLSALLGLLLLAAGCRKNTEGPVTIPSGINASFTYENYQLQEAGEASLIEIGFSKQLVRQENLNLRISSGNAVYGKDYTTEPAAQSGKVSLTAPAGSSKLFLKIIPVDNSTKDQLRELKLKLDPSGSTIGMGNRTEISVQISDDEGKSRISFSSKEATIREDEDQGTEISLSINPGALSNGFVELSTITAGVNYGEHFITEPAMNNGRIRIPIAAGANTVKFRLRPLNDAQINPDKKIRFSIINLPADLSSVQPYHMDITIVNDDLPNQVGSIASLRDTYTGTDTYILYDRYIRGVVTSVNDNLHPNIVYLEDETGGIAIRFSAQNFLEPGDVVKVNVGGGMLNRTHGYLEVANIAYTEAKTEGSEMKIIPSMTLAELYALPQNQEGKIVKISDVVFRDANGSHMLQGDRVILGGSKEAIVRTENFASFRFNVIPGGLVSVTGILLRQGSRYILLPQTGQAIF